MNLRGQPNFQKGKKGNQNTTKRTVDVFQRLFDGITNNVHELLAGEEYGPTQSSTRTTLDSKNNRVNKDSYTTIFTEEYDNANIGFKILCN